MKNIYYLGIDIGTTTISAAVIDSESRLIDKYAKNSDAWIVTDHSWEKIQSVAKITEAAKAVVSEMITRYPDISGIGVTGQMHGIVYLDENNEPVSDLYTWQDQRASQGNPSSCEVIFEKTGYKVAAGYGLATHYDLQQKQLMPEGAVKICTIMDYLVLVLTGKKENILMHASNAASLGLYDIKRGDFDGKAFKELGINRSMFPHVTSENQVVGYYREIPVMVSIGDNQAGFLYSVKEPEKMALANYGTGSQISMMIGERELDSFLGDSEIEIRPFVNKHFLLSGSALCGGRAYAMLEQFFRAYALACGQPDISHYEIINKLARQGMEEKTKLKVKTLFCGTRSDVDKRGSITGIGEENFTPQHLCVGVLRGMAEELYEMFQHMPSERVEKLAMSGNAVRKNEVLCEMIQEVFGLPAEKTEYQEEAAIGAALFAK
ncbi:MAG: hypothetical protein J5983_03240 [Ruminococcus sp.]|nr:hypothetical protein [Ruminococcus sp.]